MSDINREIVHHLEKGSDPKLKGGWSRGCPVKRDERALIEVWVAYTEKAQEVHDRLAAKYQSALDELRNLRAKMTDLQEGKHDSDLGRVKVAVQSHLDRCESALPADEGTRLIAETQVA